jgi:hypothetical protein
MALPPGSSEIGPILPNRATLTSELRIWHLAVAIAAAAVLFEVARLDAQYNQCSPLAPVLATSYFCGVLGMIGARWRERRTRKGLLLGLLLGPLGVIVAFSNPVPPDWPASRSDNVRRTADHSSVAASTFRESL